MDDESKQLLIQLVDLQKEQTELLRKYLPPLWTRIRFSLLALLLLMTVVAAGFGFTVVTIKSQKPPVTSASTIAVPTSLFAVPAPTGNVQAGQVIGEISDPPRIDIKKYSQ